MPARAADEALADAAEEVRAYVVAIRGGAPFLSAADGRLLVGWLREGVPVPLVLSCIDRVAAKRLKRRARSRLSLSRCRREVEKVWGSRPQTEPQARSLMPAGAPQQALARWLTEVEQRPLESALRPAMRELTDRVRALLQGPAMGAETLATEVIAACRDFHATAWEVATDRPALQAAARVKLGDMEGMLDPAVFDELVEEAARAHLRGRTPIVSAEVVWDRLAGTDSHAGISS